MLAVPLHQNTEDLIMRELAPLLDWYETENAHVSRLAYGFCSSCFQERILISLFCCSGLSPLLFLRRSCILGRTEVLLNFQTVKVSQNSCTQDPRGEVRRREPDPVTKSAFPDEDKR